MDVVARSAEQRLDRRLVHDFDRKSFLAVLVLAKLHRSEGALSEGLAKKVAVINVLELLEFLEVVHMEGLLALVAIDRAFLRGPQITRSIRIVCVSTAVPSIHLLQIRWNRQMLPISAYPTVLLRSAAYHLFPVITGASLIS